MPGRGSTIRIDCLTLQAAVLLCVATVGRACGDDIVSGESAAPDPAPSATDQFDRTIAPLFVRRCLDCHNGTDRKGGLDLSHYESAMAGGEDGPVLEPGRPDDSLLWQYVDDEVMPPETPLPDAEKALLRKWIAAGARWGSDPIDPYRITTATHAGYDWWSLQPVIRPPLPEVDHKDWGHNAVDRFVMAKLEAAGLTPSAAADRRTLIRRLSFDLLGLPPTPDDVVRFLADDSPHAYANLVDRLLASPHYGERWARHWLDVVRFGESHGFERERLRTNAWRYRDWVIDAFNSDMPYDRFAQLQLAGDVLVPDDPASLIATGFLVAGPYDEVGQKQQSEVMKAVVRQDELEDIVGTIGQTFLGLTVHCARCHDHKFDPVTQADYYRLTAAVAGVRHGERQLKGQTLASRNARRAVDLTAQIDKLRAGIAAIDEPIRRQILAERRQGESSAAAAQPIASWDFDGDLVDGSGHMGLTLHDGAREVDDRLVLDGKSAYATTGPIDQDVTEKTLEVWVSPSRLGQDGAVVMSLESLDGNRFDAIELAGSKTSLWTAASNRDVRTRPFGGPPASISGQRLVHFAIAYHADGTIAAYQNGQPYGRPYTASPPFRFPAEGARVVFGFRYLNAVTKRFFAGTIARARLYDRALGPEEVAASAGVRAAPISEMEIRLRLIPAAGARREQLQFEREHVETQLGRALAMSVYAVVPGEPQIAHVLLRGNPAQRGPQVAAGGVTAVSGVESDFGLAADAPDSERRRRLAQWIADRRNPLFARTIANRLWHYHFGIGLVDTPNDFGFNGGRPSHEHLLNWLAAELIDGGWRLKHLHRIILLSSTYCQSSQYNAAAAKRDADNRLLWRKTPLRLEAEALRDAVLRVAGELNPTVGGPGFFDFRTYFSSTQYYTPLDPVGVSFNRRTIYRAWARGGRSPFLDTFDCPDPSTTTPRRAITTTPVQALALMNNSFILRMSARLAERVESESGHGFVPQISRVYEHAYGRRPKREELKLARPFVRHYGLTAFCRVILNSNEFLYVD